MLYDLAKPFLYRLDAERAHRLTVAFLKRLPIARTAKTTSILEQKVGDLTFPSPVGLAAGFDKNAEVAGQMFRFGFGFVEIGSVTPRPQPGNARPRLFRLVEDRAVINRMGFNNDGGEVVAERLAALRDRSLPGPLGVNIGANKDSADKAADYAAVMRRLGPYADYVTVNVSSPNTPGLRALQDPAALEGLLAGVREAAVDLGRADLPVWLKVAPDLDPADIDAIAKLCLDGDVAALIVSNTTIARPPLQSRHAGETGGLSGAPLKDPALQKLRDFRLATGGKLPLVGVGGIANADDAWQRICAGASLVQLYSAMVYEGPALAARINRGLAARLASEGHDNIGEAVGSALPVG